MHGIEASTGGIEASTGGIEASTGGIEASTGGIEASTGDEANFQSTLHSDWKIMMNCSTKSPRFWKLQENMLLPVKKTSPSNFLQSPLTIAKPMPLLEPVT